MTSRRTVLVTGGGSGIGRAAAQSLQSGGWQVVIAGRRLEALQETAHETDMQCLQADLNQEGAGAALVDLVVQQYGRLDAVVHCAGDVQFKAVAESSVEDLRGYMRVHVESALDMVSAGWGVLSEAGPGRVVVLSSLSAHDPFPRVGVYGMAKAALEGLVRAIESDGAGAIKAFCIAPGCVDTPLLWRLFNPEDLAGVSIAQPADIAAIVVDMVEGCCDEQAGKTQLFGAGAGSG